MRWSVVPLVVMLLVEAACAAPATRPARGPATRPGDWISLFDGKKLGEWELTDFKNQAQAKVENGLLVLPAGKDLTGVTWTGEAPRTSYEIQLQAKRVEGSDFFCGLTFSVADSHASLIVGGWGGELCGISSLDGDDAAHNETSTSRKFENGRWYTITMRILPERLQAWVDDDKIVDVSIKDRKVGVRWEVEPSRPLGVASWRTTAALRSIRLRELPPEKPADAGK